MANEAMIEIAARYTAQCRLKRRSRNSGIVNTAASYAPVPQGLGVPTTANYVLVATLMACSHPGETDRTPIDSPADSQALGIETARVAS